MAGEVVYQNKRVRQLTRALTGMMTVIETSEQQQHTRSELHYLAGKLVQDMTASHL